MKHRTIKARITGWFAVLLFIIVAVVLALLAVISRQVLREDIRGSLTALVEANTQELEYLNPEDTRDVDEGDYFIRYKDGYLEIDDDFCDYDDGIYIALYLNGELIYGENPIALTQEECAFSDGQIRTVERGREKYYVYDERPEADNLQGLWLRGIVNENEGSSTLLRITRLMLPLLPGLAVIAILGGYFISRKALKPVDDICVQADSINAGEDLTRRIRIPDDSEELRRLKDAFNRMFERLNQSFEGEKQFTSDASHELRTPVAVILAECEYALEEQDPEEYKEALQVISRQGRKMSDLIEEMLTFTRIERGTVKIRKERTDLSVLASAVKEEQAMIQNGAKTLHLESQEGCYIQADPDLTARMLTNLISNACKYGKENGNVWIRVYEQRDRVVLEVEDDGIGIKEEDLPRIWQRFYRADNARSDNTSVGLGLSLVREIARLHQADTDVRSTLGKGSCFRILFKKEKNEKF